MDKYNVLWLFSDQHRGQAMSCSGDENIQTPNMDALAKEGILFPNTYSVSPLCAPFRASLYTGKMINEHGVVSLHKPPRHDLKMLAEIMQENGYYTMHCGKWHLSGGAAPCHFVSPYFRPGWDEWVGWENSNRPFKTEYGIGPYPTLYEFPGYQTDCVTDQMVNWIEERQDGEQPWFMVMSVEPPHNPHQAPEEYMKQTENLEIKYRDNVPEEWKTAENIEINRGYYAQILNLDYNIGRVIEKLKETNQYDNTIIMYFADHGEYMGSFGLNGKFYAENESSKIPFIVRHPDAKVQGIVNQDIISSLDITKTTLALIQATNDYDSRGVDLTGSILDGDTVEGKVAIIELDSHFVDGDIDKCYRCIVNEEYMYVLATNPERCRLYRQDDLYQMNNLYYNEEYQEAKAEMRALLVEQLNEFQDDFIQLYDL